MNTKLLTGMGCLLLLAAVASPGVFAHDDTCYYCDHTHDKPDGVVGTYVGSAGPALALDAYVYPQDTLAAGSMLCDAEVVFDDNTVPLGLANEPTVDGNPTIGNGVITPDGRWDDGGQGGACHVATYGTGIFNTRGCLGGNIARGETTATGSDVWLAAGCDWKIDEGGTSSDQTLLSCIINEVILQTDPLALLDCIAQFVDCLLDPACGATGATQTCGVDSSADAVNFGYGLGTAGVDAIFPSNGGIFNGPPPGHEDCVDADDVGQVGSDDSTAMIFVFDTIATNGGDYVDPDPEDEDPAVTGVPHVDVYPALTGMVWTETFNTSGSEYILFECETWFHGEDDGSFPGPGADGTAYAPNNPVFHDEDCDDATDDEGPRLPPPTECETLLDAEDDDFTDGTWYNPGGPLHDDDCDSAADPTE